MNPGLRLASSRSALPTFACVVRPQGPDGLAGEGRTATAQPAAGLADSVPIFSVERSPVLF